MTAELSTNYYAPPTNLFSVFFLARSQKKSKDIEGCLSVRGIYGEVTRSEKIVVQYYNVNGKRLSRGASGLFARIIQHEVDHLNGTLFIDKANNIQKI